METKLPRLILANGKVNPEWAKAYQEQMGVDHLEAHTQQQSAIFRMDPPSLKTASGKLSAAWVTWYKACKRVSTKIAINAGKAKIKSEEMNDDQEQSSQQPKPHRTYYW